VLLIITKSEFPPCQKSRERTLTHELPIFRQYTRDSDLVRIDIDDSGYAGRATLYFFMGVYDAVFQNYVYWIMGSLTNLPGSLSYLIGFYKGIQSAGAAGAYRADT